MANKHIYDGRAANASLFGEANFHIHYTKSSEWRKINLCKQRWTAGFSVLQEAGNFVLPLATAELRC